MGWGVKVFERGSRLLPVRVDSTAGEGLWHRSGEAACGLGSRAVELTSRDAAQQRYLCSAAQSNLLLSGCYRANYMKLLRFGLFSVFLVQMLTGVSVAQSALLPRASQDEQTLYAWLSSFDNNDFEVPRESITYTEGVSSSQELYALFYGLSGAAPDTDLINYPSRAFLLDDGKGEGIEGNGETVRILSAARSTTIGPQTAGADYLQFTGPGIFNPYYRDTGLANRLATQAVAMMMRVNDALYNDGGASFPEYVGMALAQCMSAFEAAKPYAQGITPSVSKAFYKTVESVMNWWDTNGGPRDVNTNMDTKGFYGLALLYVGSRAEGMTSISENAKNMAQKWLLGDTTDPGRAEGHKTGVIFHSAGYIGEKNMPETSYNGISLYYMVKTAAVVYGDGEWEWLWGPDGIVDRMARFKAYQIFPDPDGQYNGPSGYAVRTAFPYAEDQHSSMGRDFLVAQLSDYGLPIVYKRYNMAWDSTDITPKSLSLLDSNVRHYLKRYSSDKFALAPPVYLEMGSGSGDSRWWPSATGLVAQEFYDPAFYERVSNLVTADDPLLRLPVLRSKSDYNEVFGRDLEPPEFWAFKGGAGGREFSAFIESFSINDSEFGYDSWRGGGSLQSFWTDNAGLVINSRNSAHHYDSVEWPSVGTWATHHMWGTLADGSRFSSAQRDSRRATHTYDDNSSPSRLVSTSTPDREKGEYLGDVQFEREFRKMAGGLSVTTSLKTDGTDAFTEIWESIPVYVSKKKGVNAETQFAYWDGDAWNAMPAHGTTVLSRAIRLERDHGSGPGYVYIALTEEKPITRSSEWQCDYQAKDFYQQLMIDLHPNRGHAEAISSLAVDYEISATEPDLTRPIDAPSSLRLLRPAN